MVHVLIYLFQLFKWSVVWHHFQKYNSLSIWSRKARSTVTTCKIYCIYRGIDILTFHSYTVFSWKSLKCNLDTLTPWLTSVRRSVKPTLPRACAELTLTCRTLAHYSSASMGDRTIFLVNNSPLCVSNAKGICQNQRTCPKGRNSFDQYLLIWSTLCSFISEHSLEPKRNAYSYGF